MGQNGKKSESQYWFSFKDACVFVMECRPLDFENNPRPTLFFLHGRFGQAEIWEPLIEELAAQFRCIVIDFPGFGRSFLTRDRAFFLLEYVNLVEEIFNRFQISNGERNILIGHEVGAVISQLCALRNPEKVNALVLLNAALLTQSLYKIQGGFRGYWIRRKLRKMFSLGANIQPIYKEMLLAPWENRTSRSSLCSSFKALDESWPWHYEKQFWWKGLKTYAQPVLLLWGGNDPLSPREMGAELVQHLKDAHFYVHEKVGHWPTLENPQWVLSKLKDFIFKYDFDFSTMIAPAQKSLWQ